MNPPVPPKNKSRIFDAGGRELRLKARPPAHFISQSNPEKHINTNEPKMSPKRPAYSDPFGVFYP